ncbi:SDR family NAD(P)-dependent oxidoreductase [Thalassobius sp. S69A]|uniref:SDR family NAD(P)-dependent oxidoreductase n=1 Tax=unclassified Thalassovita TaxID=2619711 RepID=UPI000C0E489B|nr:short-chain dehydrogenase [Paracoccaceae bacterium]MBT26460.1 short-chain dehydrogenase [Paracoccaceae bacterium]
MSFAGKNVWIIGASAGIGAALARALSAQGAQLTVSARDAQALETLARDCPGARVLPLDLGQPETLDAAARLIPENSLDAVICTAALYDPGRVADLDRVRTRALVQVNLLGTFEVARLAPPLLKHGGQLVLFGSVAGYIGLPGGQAYSATKAAVNNLAETLRIELAPRVDVRLVCPGFVRSRLTDRNRFDMPAIITAEEAAQQTLRGMQGRGFEIHYPKRFTRAMKLLRALPYGLSLRLTARLSS